MPGGSSKKNTPHGDVAVSDVAWRVAPRAKAPLARVKKTTSDALYDASKQALKELLCAYFSMGDCTEKGMGISPIGKTPRGGKGFKVRWALPGMGKRGGLRLAIVAYCAEKRVMVADGFLRSDDPPDADFKSAFDDAP